MAGIVDKPTDLITEQLKRRASPSIPIGIGSCLLGAPVRFNGLGKKRNPLLIELCEHFELRSFCPEITIGLGMPREPIRLVGASGNEQALDSATSTLNVTEPLSNYGAEVIEKNPDLCGYIFVKGSPSCGMERVKRYAGPTTPACSDGVGIFTAALRRADLLLPVEEDGRLHDEHLRESFVTRVLTYYEWRQLLSSGLTHPGLQDFYARRKYLIMSHHVVTYKQLGKLLADGHKDDLTALAHRTITLIMSALARPATRSGHTNTLMHIRGYLKNNLSTAEKTELGNLIEQYRRSVVPLIAPLTLLRHHFARHPDSYIDRQVFMQPYPAELRFRNNI